MQSNTLNRDFQKSKPSYVVCVFLYADISGQGNHYILYLLSEALKVNTVAGTKEVHNFDICISSLLLRANIAELGRNFKNI